MSAVNHSHQLTEIHQLDMQRVSEQIFEKQQNLLDERKRIEQKIEHLDPGGPYYVMKRKELLLTLSEMGQLQQHFQREVLKVSEMLNASELISKISLEESRIHTFMVNDSEVHIFQKTNQLFCELFDPATQKKIRRDAIPTIEGCDVQQMIECISAFDVVLEEGDSPHFSERSIEWPLDIVTKGLENVKASLLCSKEKKLIWQLSDRFLKSAHQLPFYWNTKVTLLHPDEKTEMSALVEKVKNNLFDDQIALLKKDFMVISAELHLGGFDCKKINYTAYSRTAQRCEENRNCKRLSIEIGFFRKNTYIDSQVFVSKITWAVTVIASGGSQHVGGYNGFVSHTSGLSGNHAVIIIEGISDGAVKNGKGSDIKDGEYFIYRSELRAENDIFSEQISPEKLKQITQRTKQWLISSKKVKAMLESIEKNKKEQAFSIWGSDSYFSNGADNCFTWSREKLNMIGIHLEKSALGFIATRTKNYTQKPEVHEKETSKKQQLITLHFHDLCTS